MEACRTIFADVRALRFGVELERRWLPVCLGSGVEVRGSRFEIQNIRRGDVYKYPSRVRGKL